MRKKLGLLFALLFISVNANAQDGSLQTCQSLKDNIDRYQSLRRKGGSARQMEGWKKYKKDNEKKFNRLNCKKWRGELQ